MVVAMDVTNGRTSGFLWLPLKQQLFSLVSCTAFGGQRMRLKSMSQVTVTPPRCLPGMETLRKQACKKSPYEMIIIII